VLGTAPDAAVLAVVDAWLDADSARGLGVIHDALSSGADARQFCRQMVSHLRQLLLMQAAGAQLDVDGPVERKRDMLAQATRAPRRALIDAVRRFQEAALQPAGSWQPQLPLELAFIELLPDAPLAMRTTDDGRKTTAERPPTADRRPQQEGRTTDDRPQTTAEKTAADDRPPTADRERPTTNDQQPTTAARPTTNDQRPPPEAARPDNAPPAPLTVPAVAALWPEMTRRVGQHNKNLPALLTMCKPLAIEGRTVILGFDYPLLKDKFDKTAGAADAVVAALRELSHNTDCLIRTVTTADYPVPIHKDEFQALAAELGGVVRDDE